MLSRIRFGNRGLGSGSSRRLGCYHAIPHALSQTGATLIGNAGAACKAFVAIVAGSIGWRPAFGRHFHKHTAWLAVGLTVTNAINFVQFDAGFTDTNAAQGLLTVYWNTNQVGIMVDERVAPTNLQTYRFTLPAR